MPLACGVFVCFTSRISHIITDWLVFIIEIQCVFCEIGTVFKGTEWQQLYWLRDHPASYSLYAYRLILFLWNMALKSVLLVLITCTEYHS
jgi:hypothetical protein